MKCIRCGKELKGMRCECGIFIKDVNIYLTEKLTDTEISKVEKFIKDHNEKRKADENLLIEEFDKIYAESKDLADNILRIVGLMVDSIKLKGIDSTLIDSYDELQNVYNSNVRRAIQDTVGKAEEVKGRLSSEDKKKNVDDKVQGLIKTSSNISKMLKLFKERLENPEAKPEVGANKLTYEWW